MPTPTGDYQIGEVGPPKPIWRCRLFLELLRRLDHDVSGAGDQSFRLEKAINENFRHKLASLVRKPNRRFARRKEILTLADELMPDNLEGKERGVWVHQQRLRVDSRKWLAAKLHPWMYGERLKVNTTDTRNNMTAALAEAEHRMMAGQLQDQNVGLIEGSRPDNLRK
jgi:hypothetical protein